MCYNGAFEGLLDMAKKLTQTEIGNYFGLSSVAMGKKLVELNLKDKDTKIATDYAIKKKLAKNVLYTNNGVEATISIWDRSVLNYIKQKVAGDVDFLSDVLFNKFKAVTNKAKEYQKNGRKQDLLELDYVEDIFLKEFHNLKNNDKVLSCFVLKLKNKKLLDKLSSYAEYNELLRFM